MTRVLRLLPFFCALLFSCCSKTVEDKTQLSNVFGPDDRQVLTSTQFPWSTIGRVLSPNGGVCTGTLVGKNLVLTAAHCIVDGETKLLMEGEFKYQPNYFDGSAIATYDADWLYWGTSDPSKYRAADWAVIQLKENAGYQFGWLGIKSTSVEDFPSTITVAGYSGDFMKGETAGIHHDCSTRSRDVENQFVLHDCDTTVGSSGGPALARFEEKLMIHGINVAEFRAEGPSSLHHKEYDDKKANIVISAAEALERIERILRQ